MDGFPLALLTDLRLHDLGGKSNCVLYFIFLVDQYGFVVVILIIIIIMCFVGLHSLAKIFYFNMAI